MTPTSYSYLGITRIALSVAAIAAVLTSFAVAGDCCSNKGQSGLNTGAHSFHEQGAAAQHVDKNELSILYAPPHGGQVHHTESMYFEVVYLPRQTRIYLYGAGRQPISPRGSQGQAVMHVRGHDQPFDFPIRYYTVPGGSVEQEFLAAAVDVTRIPDGAMTVDFELTDLPDQKQSQASFAQTFALTRHWPAVTVAAVSDADTDAIGRQRVCPITGGPLGGMGTPVKLIVGDQVLYVCCHGCIDKVRQAPEKYVSNRAPGTQRLNQPTHGNELLVVQATVADQAAIQAQALCAVMKTRLGAMGTPVKIVRGNQAVFVCCQGCVAKVKANPDLYFSQVVESRHNG